MNSKKYIGMDVAIVPGSKYILLDQKIYVEDKFCEYTMEQVIPMNDTTNLRTAVPNVENESLLPITGKLLYMADRTGPDILVSTGEISTGGAYLIPSQSIATWSLWTGRCLSMQLKLVPSVNHH